MKTLHFNITYRNNGAKAGRAGRPSGQRGKRARSVSAGVHAGYVTRALDGAAAHAGYVTRATHRTSEDLVATGYGNLPTWAHNDPMHFFEESSQRERIGGRTATQLTMQLPRELTHAQQRDAVENFVRGQLGTQHAYVWGIHEVTARDGWPQPHVHLAFCERTDTGQDLGPTEYFSGHGYRKNRTFNDKGWPGAARQAWSDTLNSALEQAGSGMRVDPRTFRAQGIDQDGAVRVSLEALRQNPAIVKDRASTPDTPERQARRATAWEDRKQVLGLTVSMSRDEIVQRIGEASRESIIAHQIHRRHLAQEVGSDESAMTQRLAVTHEKQEQVRTLARDETQYVQHPERPRSMEHLAAVARLLQSTDEDTPQRRRRRHLGRDDEGELGQRRGYGISQ